MSRPRPNIAEVFCAAFLQKSGRLPSLRRFEIQRVAGGADGADDVDFAGAVDGFAQAADMDVDGTGFDMDVPPQTAFSTSSRENTRLGWRRKNSSSRNS